MAAAQFSRSVRSLPMIAGSMKLQHKAWLVIVSTIAVLTLGSVLGSQYSIIKTFEGLERNQFRVESERGSRLLNQQLEGLTATVKDYAYWSDTVEFTQGVSPDYFSENFGTDNMSYLGISHVLILDSLGRPLASAELTSEPSLQPISEGMSQMLRSLAVSVLSDKTSKTVMRTYREMDGHLYLVSIAAVRSQFEAASTPEGALAAVRRFDETQLARFSDVLMHPVRLSLSEAPPIAPDASTGSTQASKVEASAPVVDHEGRAVAHLILELDRELLKAGNSLALVAAMQVALAGLIVGTILVLLLNRLILRRLQGIHEDLVAVTRHGVDGQTHFAVKGNDELTDLAKGFNDLLVKTREDAEQQRQAYQRQEALHLQLLQSQKTEALGRFTSGIAHDFNNSLAAISGWVRLAMEDLTANHPSAPSLAQALKSIGYATGLMKQLLSFSRQSTPRMECLRLSALIEEARTLVSLGLMGRCTLQVDCRTVDDWIQADPTQMKQVIVNLLINACDAMNGKGAIALTLDTHDSSSGPTETEKAPFNQLPQGRYITLCVRDQGPGIAPEHLDRIFEPFFTTKGAEKGTGLGLSVVQGIMARHSGAVCATSKLGEGAFFELVLPAQEDPNPSSIVRESTLPTAKKRKLLYAEDDVLVRDAWSALLERQGWEVTCARDGEEAWGHFQAKPNHWDAVLTDLSMPRMSGLQLANQIASTGSSPPILLMSGQISLQDEEVLKQARFNAVLLKPVDQDELLRALHEATSISD